MNARVMTHFNPQIKGADKTAGDFPESAQSSEQGTNRRLVGTAPFTEAVLSEPVSSGLEPNGAEVSAHGELKVSLILATVNRTNEPHRFLSHLTAQEYKNFEVIVVDQNDDNRLAPVLADFPQLKIQRVRSPRGLSRARNVGMRHAAGDIVAFPDDDCWYDANTLTYLVDCYRNHPEFDGLLGRTIGPSGEFVHGMRSLRQVDLRQDNAVGRCNSNTLSFRTRVFETVLGFDETLGVGSGTPWTAGEDIDLPLQVIHSGFRLVYDPRFVVRHPIIQSESTAQIRKLGASYGRGVGRVLRKHSVRGGTLAVLFARPLLGAGWSLLRGRLTLASFYGSIFWGRITGWLQPYPSSTPARSGRHGSNSKPPLKTRAMLP